MEHIDKDISDSQYAGDLSLDYVSIGEDVNRIGKKAFENCQNLIAIRIEESDKPIKISFDYVKGCKNLVEVSIKRKVEFFKEIKVKGAKLYEN